jgi:hypothetical protein
VLSPYHETTSQYPTSSDHPEGGQFEELVGRIGGERSFLIPHSLTGCREETRVMSNVFLRLINWGDGLTPNNNHHTSVTYLNMQCLESRSR